MTSAENPQQRSSGNNLNQFKGQIILPFSFIYCLISTTFLIKIHYGYHFFYSALKIIELTLIVLIGYGLVKSKLLKSEDSKPLSIIGLYVISPSVMIEAFQINYTSEILQGLQLSLLMAVFLHIILIIIGSLLKRLLNLDPIEHATSIYSNSGNLIIPIVMSLFGKEWVIYASCFYCGSNLSILDTLPFDYCRKRKFIAEDDCQKHQYLVNSRRSIFVCFSN